MSDHSTHKWEIKPKNSVFELMLKDVWEYRDLLMLFVKRDFVSFYKQTLLGPLWFFIQPLLQTLIFTFVFSRMAHISTDGLPSLLFYLSGITAWNYFADCLTKTSTVFRDNAHIFGKVYFPRLVMPISIVISNLVRFGVQILLLIVFMAFYSLKGTSYHIDFHILLFPVLVILMAALGLSTGMIISALTIKYRDLAFLVTFGIQLLMYATTVIYPLSSVNATYRVFVVANPMTAILETFRNILFGSGHFSWPLLGYATVTIIILLVVGIITFNKVQKDFVDTV